MLRLPRLKVWWNQAVAVAEVVGPDRAGDVAAAGRMLDLDHVGAEVGQELRAIGPRAVVLDGQDPHAPEQFHQTGLRSISWRAITIRCISLVPSPMHIRGASR